MKVTATVQNKSKNRLQIRALGSKVLQAHQKASNDIALADITEDLIKELERLQTSGLVSYEFKTENGRIEFDLGKEFKLRVFPEGEKEKPINALREIDYGLDLSGEW